MHDDFKAVRLSHELVESPPVVLWPEPRWSEPVPPDLPSLRGGHRRNWWCVTTRWKSELVTPSETFLIKYDMIRRVYEGSLTKRPAFVLVGARVLIGNWEERYLVTGRVAHLLRKNWEAHKLGHAMQYEM